MPLELHPPPDDQCSDCRHFVRATIVSECDCSGESNAVRSPRPASRPAARIIAAVVVIFAGLAAAYFAVACPISSAEPRAYIHIERDGMRYEFNLVLGTESLTEIGAARRDVLGARPADAARLRRALADELGVESLEDLRSNQEDQIERLRALGYL